jgi:two-component system, cell cycle sensor histidine kinase and response regulator CckA
VTVAAHTGEALPVSIDPTKLRQLLMNLIDNAFDAMPDGGELALRTGEVTLAENPGEAAGDLAPGRYAALTVADTGAGMPADVMARALEPAFTTKPSGSGTGLGLSIAHGVVHGAGGRITLRSEPGSGTTVEILLPWASAPISAPPAAVPPIAAPVATEHAARPATILLVDDDAAVLDLTARVLGEQGYAVIAAPDAERALAAAREHPVDLLLTDQTMPGASGLELSRRIGELRPGTRAIIMSGYVAEVAASQPDGVDWLQKPFGAGALIGSVRDALARG